MASPGACPQHPALLPGPAERGTAPEPLCLPSPRQLLAALEGAGQPAGLVARWKSGAETAPARLWARRDVGRTLCGSKFWILMLLALRACGPWSGGVQHSRQQCSWGQLETPGTASGAFPYLHGQRPWARGALKVQRTAAHPRHEVWNRLAGNPRGSWGCWMPFEPFCAALRKCNGDLLTVCLCFAWGRGIKSSLMEQTKM